MTSAPEGRAQQALWASLVFAASLAAQGAYSFIAHGTYDYDEFVYLLLGRAIAHGHVPYRDFLFYHPPGIIVTMAAMNGLIEHWWVAGRALSLLLAAGTCALVYLAARRLASRPVAVTAGLLCACSPIMLTTGTRIMPDIYVAFFTFLATYLLLVSENRRWAVLAGISFGIAIIFKYPAILTLPACLLLAGKRRSPVFLGVMLATVALLLLPLLPEWQQYLTDTVVFQSGRSAEPIVTRFLGVVLFAVVFQPLAAFGAFVRPRRAWLLVGYLAAFLYVGTPQVYYHYMAPMIPFASILGALYLASLKPVNIKVLVPAAAVGAACLTLIWASIIEYTPGQSPFHLTAAQVTNVLPVEHWVKRHVPRGGVILDDRPEVPFLSGRLNCSNYFWNDATQMTSDQLDHCLTQVRFVVHSYGPASGFPPGFLSQLDRKHCHVDVGSSANGAFVYDNDRPRGHAGCPYLPLRR